MTHGEVSEGCKGGQLGVVEMEGGQTVREQDRLGETGRPTSHWLCDLG